MSLPCQTITAVLTRKGERTSLPKRFQTHTIWLEPLLGMKKSLKHAFVEEHITHRFGDDDVDQLRQINFLDLAGDYIDTIGEKIVLYECLKCS